MRTERFEGGLLSALLIAVLAITSMAFVISTTPVNAPSTISASPGATLSPTSARENTSIEFTVTVTNDYATDNIDNVILLVSGFTQLTDLRPTTWDLSELLSRNRGVRFDAIGDNVITPGGSETFVFLWTTPNIAGDYMISVLVSKEEVTYTTYENLGGFIVTIGELDWEFVDVTAIDLEPPEKDVGSTTATITTPDIVTVAMENAYPDYTAEVSVWAYNSGTIPLRIEKVVIDGTEITGEPPYPVVQLDLNEDGEDDIEIEWRDGFGEQLEPGDDSPEMSFWVRVLQGIPQEETLNSTIEIVAVPWNVASLGLVPLYWSDSIEIDLTVVVISPIQESPWPMFQHDPQHTGKSPYVGPQTNNLLWSRDLGNKWLGPSIIGSDNSIYVPAQGLVALTPNGSIKWQTGVGTAGSRTVTPAIAADGTIYVGYAYSWKLGGYGTGFLYAVNHDTGYRTWTLDVNLTTSLLIAPEGTIYTGIGEGAGRIDAFDLNGTVKWTFAATPSGGWPRTPAIGLDDSIIASILFSGANSPNPTVYALDPADGTERWRLELPERANVSSPTIGSDGTIYVRTPRRLYAISQNGSLKWELELGSRSQVTPPAVGPDGTIYVAYFSGDGALYAITPDGSIKWSYPARVVSSPVIDAEGTIYCAAVIGDVSPSEKSLIFALNPDGTLKWDYVVDGYTGWSRTALSLSESRLYVGVDDGTLYAFGPGVLDTTPPTISDVESSDITQDSATITWTTDEPSDSLVEYGTTIEYGLTASDAELVTSHSITLTGLSAGTLYHYRVKSADAFGNPAISSDRTFTTPALNQPPNPPTDLLQFKSDGITAISVGGETLESTVVFKGVVSDPDWGRVKLQIELRRIDEYEGEFTEEFTHASEWISSGEQANITVYELVDGGYHWQARALDEAEPPSPWVSFGNNQISDVDFVVGVNQSPTADFNYSPENPKAGEETRLDASDSLDSDGRIEFYEWDLEGDGEYDGFTTSPVIYYYWDESGTYSVKLKVTDDGGATDTFVKDINVQPSSWWEKTKKFFGSSIETLSESEKRRFEIIKSELRISNIWHSDDPLNDPDFYWISDDQLLTVLKKKIEPQAGDTTYETLIIDTIHDMKLTDSVANRSWSSNPEIEKYFQNMAEINVWAEAGELINKELLEGTIKAAGGTGIGVGSILMLPDLWQAGIGIKLLDETFYRRALWHYFQNREMGDSPEVAFGSSPVPAKYYNEVTREYFESLWTEYGGPHISDGGGLKHDFQEQIINQLRTLLLSGLEKYKFEPYHLYRIKSPVEIRVYDSQGRVTGLVSGEAREEITNSAYDENKTVLIFPATDFYHCQVVGTDEGTYGLTITFVKDGEATDFTATDIPTTSGATHQYTIDWDAFSEDEGVTLQIDSDGNGTFEQTFTADSELTHDEFMLQTATTIDFDPDTLNLKNKGKVVTVYIELPEGYSVENIDVSTVRLIVDNDNVPAEPRPTGIGDHDNDGIPDLMVKFSRSAVQAIVGMGEVELTVTGLVNGMPFEGNDTIRVIKLGKADLEIRFMEIPLGWAMSPPKGKLEIEIEFSQIPLYWALAPS